MIQAAATLSRDVGKKAACQAMEVFRASFYRHLNPVAKPEASRPRPPLALSQFERQAVLGELHSERFQDKAPLEVYATLLDDGRYLCSPPGQCIVFWPLRTAVSKSGGGRFNDRITTSPNFWPPHRTRCGHGI